MSGSSVQVTILWPKTVCQQDGGDIPVTSGERADITAELAHSSHASFH